MLIHINDTLPEICRLNRLLVYALSDRVLCKFPARSQKAGYGAMSSYIIGNAIRPLKSFSCALAIIFISVSGVKAASIPIEEEYILAMQYHVDTTLAFMRERLVLSGYTGPYVEASVSGQYNVGPVTGIPYDGLYDQTLVWQTLEAIENTVYRARVRHLATESEYQFDLESEGVWASGPMKGKKIISVGTYKEFSDKSATIDLVIETQGDADPFPFSGIISGELNKIKKDGKLTATGDYYGDGTRLRIAFVLLQDSKEFTSKVSFGLSGMSASFTNKGKADGSDVKYQISNVPLPAALPLFLTGLAGLGLLGWKRRPGGGTKPNFCCWVRGSLRGCD